MRGKARRKGQGFGGFEKEKWGQKMQKMGSGMSIDLFVEPD